MEKPLIALLTNNDDDVFCFRLELIEAILQAGYAMLISCPDGPKFEAMTEYGLHKNQEFIYDDPQIDRRGTSIINDWNLIQHYKKLFKKYRPKVILTYTAKPNVYASLVANKLHIPVINNVTGLGSVLNKSGLKYRIIMTLFKLAYTKSACIMFQNSTNMDFAKKLGWVKGDYKLIPGSGVALTRYPLQDYPDGGDGMTGEPVIFNYIGRILHDKGVDDYIEAAKKIKEKYPKTEFNILGFIEPQEIYYEDKLRQLEHQGIIYYRGSQKDVKPWIRRSHCIIHPSTYGEGMSNVLLENAACGRPIITTDNPGCRETVDDKISGFIFPRNDISSLIDRIEFFLQKIPNSIRKQMGLAGRKKVEKEFDRKIVIGKYLQKINELLSY